MKAEAKYRRAAMQDAAQIREIYGHYVENSVWTFRTACPDKGEYETAIQEGIYPFWVAEAEGEILGFACAERLRPHDAYLWDVELTIYLHPQAPQNQGLGSGLYKHLLTELAALGFLNAYAVITGSNLGSIAFHERLGFVRSAHFPKMGFKHGAWHDVVWMQKALGKVTDHPELPLPFQKK